MGAGTALEIQDSSLVVYSQRGWWVKDGAKTCARKPPWPNTLHDSQLDGLNGRLRRIVGDE